MRIITHGAADQSVELLIIDSADGTPETGVVFNTSGIDLWYRRPGAVKTSITEVTLASLTTAHTDGGFLHIDNGVYRLDLPDAAVASGVDHVVVGGTVTGMIVKEVVVQLSAFDLQTATQPVNVTQFGGTNGTFALGIPSANVRSLPTVWYVDDAGNDSNDGKTWSTPKLTLAAVQTAATEGDVIKVGPGTYSGVFTASKDGITWEGVDAATCVITHNSGNTLTITGDHVTFRRLTVTASAETLDGTGVYANAVESPTLDQCIVNGHFDGVNFGSCKRILISRCKIAGTYDGLNSSACSGRVVDSHISTNCAYSGDTQFRAVFNNDFVAAIDDATTNMVYDNCTMVARRTGTSAANRETIGFMSSGLAMLINCHVIADATNASYTGAVWGVRGDTRLSISYVYPGVIQTVGGSITVATSGSGAALKAINSVASSRMTLGTPFTAAEISGTVLSLPTDAVALSGDRTAADNLESATDGTGYNVGNGSIVSASVTGNVTGSTGSISGVTFPSGFSTLTTANIQSGLATSVALAPLALEATLNLARGDISALRSDVDADVVVDGRTWFATNNRARNIIQVQSPFQGTFALQPDLNPGTTIATVDSVVMTGPADVDATDLKVNRAYTRAHFSVPALTTPGTYTVVVTVTTIDGQTIPTTGTLKVY